LGTEKNKFDYISVAKRVLDIESSAIADLKSDLGESFINAAKSASTVVVRL